MGMGLDCDHQGPCRHQECPARCHKCQVLAFISAIEYGQSLTIPPMPVELYVMIFDGLVQVLEADHIVQQKAIRGRFRLFPARNIH